MSFHHINLQRDALWSKRSDEEDGDAPPPTPFVAFPSLLMTPGGSIAVNLSPRATTATTNDEEKQFDQNNQALSDVESHYSQKSWWADLSEVDSMAASTRKSSGMSIASIVSDETEEEEEKETRVDIMVDHDELEHENDDGFMETPQVQNHYRSVEKTIKTTIPLHGENSVSRSKLRGREDHQSCGDSTVEEGSIASVYDRSSVSGGAGSSGLRKHVTNPRQRYEYEALLRDAELQAAQARQELEIVQKQLDTLLKRQLVEKNDMERTIIRQQALEHELRMELKSNETEYKMVRDRLMDAVKENKSLIDTIREQEDTIASKSQEHDAMVCDLEEQLRVAEQAKATAEAKLEEALEKIEVLQKEVAAQSATRKSVRFANAEHNEVIFFRKTDYASRLQQSQSETQVLSAQILSMQLEMEALEVQNATLHSLHQETKVDHLTEIMAEKQVAQEARTQVRDLLSSLIEIQQNAERIEMERLALEEQLHEAQESCEQTTMDLQKKNKYLYRVEKEIYKINKAIASLQTTEDANATLDSNDEGFNEINLLYELEKARFRMEKQANAMRKEQKTLQETADAATAQHNQINDKLVVMELEKKELMQQLEDLKRTVTALREEIRRITDEKVAIEQALAKQQSFVEDSQTRVQELELERVSLLEELSIVRNRNSVGDIQEAPSETLRFVGSNEEREVQLANLQNNLAKAEEELEREREVLRQRVEHCHRMESELETIQTHLDQAKEDTASMEASHIQKLAEQASVTRAAQAKADKALEQLEELKRHQSDTQSQLTELSEARVTLQKQLQETMDQLWFTQQEKAYLQTRITNLDLSLQEARSDATCNAATNVFALQKNSLLKQIRENESRIVELQKQIDTAEETASVKDQKIEDMKSVERALNEQIHSVQTELDATRVALQKAQTHILLLEDEKAVLVTNLSDAKETIVNIEESKRLLEEQKHSVETLFEEKLTELENQIEVCASHLNKKEEECSTLTESVKSLTFVNRKLESQLDETTVLWEDAKEQFHCKKKELESTKLELVQHQRENNDLLKLYQSSKDEESILSSKLEEASHQVEELHSEVVLLGQRNNTLEETNAECKNAISSLKNGMVQLKQEKDRMSKEHEKVLQEEISSMNAALAKAKCLEDERNSLQGRVELLQANQSSLEKKLEDTEELWKEATDRCRKKQQQIRSLETKLKSDEQERSALEKERARLMKLLEEESAEKFELQLELSATITKLTLLDRQLQATRSQLENESDSFDKLKSSRSKELEDAKAEMATLLEQVTSTKTTVAALQSQNGDLKVELASTADALKVAEREKQEANKEVDALRSERDRALQAEHGIRKISEDLQTKLDSQSKKLKKLAKLLKRTLQQQASTETLREHDENKTTEVVTKRVSKMAFVLNLRFRNRISGAFESMEVEAQYSGPLVNGKPHGPGVLRFESGDLYLGEFKDGEINSQGSYVRQRPERMGTDDCISGLFAGNQSVVPTSPISGSLSERSD